MLKESSFVKEWIQEGWEKGQTEGHTAGLREGQIKIIIKQLVSILGRVSSDLEAKIRSLSDSEIERLSEDLLRMKNIIDLEEWFRIREENSKN